jgi:2-oxoglutarate ferredoxin oxidoreductase subunit alpha
MTSLTMEVGKEAGVKPRDAERSKNFFALGLISWLYSRPTEPTLEWIREVRFAKPLVLDANTRAFKAGFNFGETAELFESNYQVRRPSSNRGPTPTSPGTPPRLGPDRRRPPGPAAHLPRAPIRSPRLRHPPRAVQAQAVRGADLPGRGRDRRHRRRHRGRLRRIARGHHHLGAGHRPQVGDHGMAVSLELPLLVVDIQRGGPSTGLPTKTEQSDLLHAMYGRHGEAPVPIVAAMTPSHCFEAAMEAVRIAVKYRTPVILLSDGYLANGSEPWRLPDLADLPEIDTGVRHRDQPHRRRRIPGPSGPTSATRTWPDPGPCPGPRASSTGSAVWRRPRGRATSPTTPRTTSA